MAQGKAKRPSRSRLREEQLAAAAAAAVGDAYDVAVLGGGAAGLVAAIAAAEAGAKVLVLERDLECGRSILATGNGRCNFSTVELDPRRYNDEAFVSAVFGQDPLSDILDFFRTSGLAWDLEESRLYPHSRRAASVRNVLLRRAARAGATLAPARTVTELRPAGEGFSVRFAQQFDGSERSVAARRVVLANGGVNAVDLAGLDPLKTVARRPLLCPVACADSLLAALDGRRVHANVVLLRRGVPFWHERGEVLFRSYGLSGIVVFDLSRRVQAGDVITVDLAPDMTPAELRQLTDPFAHGTFQDGCLDGVVDPDVAAVLERLARERWELPALADALGYRAPASDSEALLKLVKELPFEAVGTADEAHAQVTAGGLATSQFDPATLEASALPGLFACGEALDVDGDCGGFNLSWAWKSGMVAGKAAAERARDDRPSFVHGSS